MNSARSTRQPGPLGATFALLVAVAGLLLTPIVAPGRSDPARRVRTSGACCPLARVTPYGRAAFTHAYFDDDGDEAALAAPTLAPDKVDLPAHAAAAAADGFRLAPPTAVSWLWSPGSALVVHSADGVAVPPGRAPPLT